MQITRRQFLRQISILGVSLPLLKCGSEGETEQPNIIYIMIDDLGYGDVGCYGSEINSTPNIDRIAAEGMLFTDHHSNGPMCSPTRAAFMTGMYQHRLGEMFESAISGKTDYDSGLPGDTYTLPEALKDAGYATGMFGKWHLGYQPPFLPTNHGFDEFIGLVAGDGDHHTHIDRWGRKDWWHNEKIAMEDGYSTDLITDHSIDFIEKHQNKPFFLYVSHLSIHFPWQGPDDPPHRKAGTIYTDEKWGIIPNPNNVSPHVQSMISSVDKNTGRILQTLDRLNLTDNTVLIFTSDNGGYIHYGDTHFNISSNGPLRGQKTEVYEGGHRVPFIARWPGRIPADATSDALTMTMDMFPTFAALAGADLAGSPNLDGIDLLPHLIDGKTLPERPVCWKIGDERAIRKGPWKLCLIGDNPPELYNLSDDIGETTNLAQSHPELVRQLSEQYREWEKEVTSVD